VLTAADPPRRVLHEEYGLYDAGACMEYPNELGKVQVCRQERRPVQPRCAAAANATP
jgi:hypothetical protein